ncbi:unnamed protein product [Didymodactylos carnosus]|nr:unnamed protein product [Didymodactylos carnosus]CAF3517062.1 unnamed protein product [Didymodactylos carnosus]
MHYPPSSQQQTPPQSQNQQQIFVVSQTSNLNNNSNTNQVNASKMSYLYSTTTNQQQNTPTNILHQTQGTVITTNGTTMITNLHQQQPSYQQFQPSQQQQQFIANRSSPSTTSMPLSQTINQNLQQRTITVPNNTSQISNQPQPSSQQQYMSAPTIPVRQTFTTVTTPISSSVQSFSVSDHSNSVLNNNILTTSSSIASISSPSLLAPNNQVRTQTPSTIRPQVPHTAATSSILPQQQPLTTTTAIPSSPLTPRPEQFQQLIKFCRQFNLKDTEETLTKEYQQILDSQKPSDMKTTSTVTSLKFDSEQYFQTYDAYLNYIQEQNESNRHEFSQLLYPLFVHMYLELIENDKLHEAQRFFHYYTKTKPILQQKIFVTHEDDLYKIKSLLSKQQIEQSDFVKSFRSNGRYWIKLCDSSLKTLDQLLIKQQKYPLLTRLIQQYMQLEISDGQARNVEIQQLLSGGRLGEIKTDDNQNKMYYGLLKEHDLTRIQYHKTLLAPPTQTTANGTGGDEEQQQDEQQPQQKPTITNRKKLKRDIFSQRPTKSSQRVDPNSPLLTRVPIPELREHERIDLLNMYNEDYTRILKVTEENLPSCCYYTLLNGYLEINYLELSDDSTLLAVGCKNSTILIYSLNRRKLITMKLSNGLDTLDKSNEHVYEQMMMEENDEEVPSSEMETDKDNDVYSQRLLCGHTGPIYGLSMSRDKWFLLSCSEDCTIRLWSLLTFTCLVVYRGHMQPVFDIQFGPFGHYFASCSLDKTVRLWCMDHSQTLRIYTDTINDIETVCFHPNSNYLATSSSDRLIKIWDLLETKDGNANKPIRQMSGHKLPICIKRFTKDGKYLISCGYDRHIMIWDMANGALLTSFIGHNDAIFSMDYSRDGNILVTGSLDFTIKLWNLGKLIKDAQDQKLETLNKITPNHKYEMVCYRTKRTSTILLHFTRRNLLMGVGVFIPLPPTALSEISSSTQQQQESSSTSQINTSTTTTTTTTITTTTTATTTISKIKEEK